MARVPTIVGPEVLPDVNAPVYQSGAGATPEAFGSASARSLIFAGSELGKTSDLLASRILKQQAEDNELRAKQLDNEFAARLREIGYGDGTDENPGYYSTKGQAALDAQGTVQDAIRRARAAVMQQAGGNERVQQMLGLSTDVRINTELTRIASHTSTERVAAQQTVSDARKQEAADDAAANWNDSATLTRSLEIAVAEAHGDAERAGITDPEAIANVVGAAQTVVLKNTIEAAMETDPVAAQAIYDANKDLIDGTARADLEKKLMNAGIYTMAQNVAEEAIALYPGNVQAQRQHIRDTYEGRVESEALDDLERRYAEKRGDAAEYRAQVNFAQAQADRAAEGQALSDLFGIEDPDKARAMYAALRAADNLNAMMDNEEKRQLEDDKKAINAALSAGTPLSVIAQGMPDEYQNLIEHGLEEDMIAREQMAAEGREFAWTTITEKFDELRFMSSAELARVNLEDYKPYLTKEDYAQAREWVAGAQGSVATELGDSAPYTEGRGLLKDLTPGLKWDSYRADDDDVRAQNALVNSMNAFVQNYTRINGRAPDRVTLYDEAVRLTTRGEIPGTSGLFGLGGNDSFYVGQIEAMTAEERATFSIDIDDIPMQARADYEAAISTAIAKGTLREIYRGNEALIESLAGADALNDDERFERLLKGQFD